MVERIRTLLESRQLTPTQFADIIGIARPIVSHILSGRNKPSLEVVQRILAAMPDLSMAWLLNGSEPMLAASPLISAGDIIPSGPATPIARNEAMPAPTSLKSPDNQCIVAGVPPVTVAVPATEGPYQSQVASGIEPAARVSRTFHVKPERFTARPTLAAIAAEPVTPVDTEQAETAPKLDAVFQNGALAPATEVLAAPAATLPTIGDGPASIMADAMFAGAEKPIRRIVIFYRDGSFADYQPE
jgi:transcriptional regulator with XRE-family HTH domain